jgi:hypothetical protein
MLGKKKEKQLKPQEAARYRAYHCLAVPAFGHPFDSSAGLLTLSYRLAKREQTSLGYAMRPTGRPHSLVCYSLRDGSRSTLESGRY